MLSKELIKQIRHIQLKAGHLASEALAGEYASAFKGQGMEFDEVREYTPGDDVRAIDWNVTARMDHPFIKIFREERELTLMLVVDVSASQSYGTTERHKRVATAELAAVLAFLAIKSHDKVGLVIFSDHIEHYIPPGKGRGHVWRIIRDVMTHEGKGHGTDIGLALEFVGRVLKRKSLVFFVSDFLGEGYERALKQVSRRHDLVCVRVEDDLESNLPNGGVTTYQDLETGELVVVDSGNKRVRAAFAENRARIQAALVEQFRGLGVDQFVVRSASPLTEPLTRYMRTRERKGKRRA